jgi:hypothetical protein
MTEGQYRVGINFNPGGHPAVNYIKDSIAELIDYVQLNGLDDDCTRVACERLEDAAMWGVKSVTKPPRGAH